VPVCSILYGNLNGTLRTLYNPSQSAPSRYDYCTHSCILRSSTAHSAAMQAGFKLNACHAQWHCCKGGRNATCTLQPCLANQLELQLLFLPFLSCLSHHLDRSLYFAVGAMVWMLCLQRLCDRQGCTIDSCQDAIWQ